MASGSAPAAKGGTPLTPMPLPSPLASMLPPGTKLPAGLPTQLPAIPGFPAAK